jgi:hypothetical protein
VQLFLFDAALDEDVAFALDRASPDLLADCLVPEADDVEPQQDISLPVADYRIAATESNGSAASRRSEAPISTSSAPLAAYPAPMPVHNTPSYNYSATETLPNLEESYIPFSLVPVDPSARHMALVERRKKVDRFREKKKNRQFKKLIRYASRKRYAEVRPRIKGRFARKDEIAAAKAVGVPLVC